MSRSTLLITSAAYVDGELAAEFGRLPPAFLPVGNRRLFTHQHAAMAEHFDRVLLTLPESFDVDEHDQRLLASLAVEIIQIPDDQSLVNSIISAISQADIEDGAIALLFGDTLMYDVPCEVPDSIIVCEATNAYHWAGCRIEGGCVRDVFDLPVGELDARPILSGFFHFGDLNQLVLSLAASRGDFIIALQRYLARRPMAALEGPRWLDFGHLHTYYASRGRITTERAFNSLAVGNRIVAKLSSRVDRMEAEANWYEQVPTALRIFLPNYLGRCKIDGKPGYSLEFLYMASLADLFVFGRLPEAVWVQIFQSCLQFLSETAKYPAPASASASVMGLYLPKTLERLEEFARQQDVDLEHGWRINGVAVPGLAEIARRSAESIAPPRSRHMTIMHGDACFSNIMYDFRSRSVRMIDPRGQDSQGRPTIWGDNRYDLAKLHHSISGNYDMIIAGYSRATRLASYEINLSFPATPYFAAARSAFGRVFGQIYRTDVASIEAISLHLFLSMLPLHSDSPGRQWTFVANALRLYSEISCARLAA